MDDGHGKRYVKKGLQGNDWLDVWKQGLSSVDS